MKRKSDLPQRNGKEGQEQATKADVAAVKSELKADVAALRSEMATKADLNAVQSELKADVAAVKAGVAGLRADMTMVRSDVDTVRANMNFMKSELECKIGNVKREVIEQVNRHMDKNFGEFINHVDAVFGEVKTMREEQAFFIQHTQDHADRLDNHDKRITKLEAGVGGRAG